MNKRPALKEDGENAYLPEHREKLPVRYLLLRYMIWSFKIEVKDLKTLPFKLCNFLPQHSPKPVI